MAKFDPARPAGERMAVLETWAEGHDVDCDKRWSVLINLIGWGGGAAFALIISVAGFGLKAVYDQQQVQNKLVGEYISQRK